MIEFEVQEISEKRAQQIQEAYALSSSNIKSIEMSCRGSSIYMTVDRMLVGVTEYKIITEPKEEPNDKKLIDEFCDTLAVFDTSKYTRTSDYIRQESERLIQAVRDYDNKPKEPV